MRNKVSKRLNKLAAKLSGSESTLRKHKDGSLRWDGKIRKYKDLKKEYKSGGKICL